MSSASLRFARILAPFAIASGLLACGTRSGLPVPEPVEPADVTFDVSPDVSPDVSADVSIDAPVETPTVVDAELDVNVPEAPPPICTDPSVTLVYLITEANELVSYYPPTNAFHRIGIIDCSSTGATPFSMAVDRTGLAYVIFTDGNLYNVSTKTAACSATSYEPQAGDYMTFGMGFSAESDGTESLYVASFSTPSNLGHVVIPGLEIVDIAAIDSTLLDPELTGTGAGQLFGFGSVGGASSGLGSIVSAIDKTTGAVTQQATLPTVQQGSAWAFAFYGGDFYLFTAPDNGNSIVTRFDPSKGTTEVVAQFDGVIVGAGVSTCAPSQ